MAASQWRSLADRLALAQTGDANAFRGTGGIDGCLTEDAFSSGAALRAACQQNERGGPPVGRPPWSATPLIG